MLAHLLVRASSTGGQGGQLHLSLASQGRQRPDWRERRLGCQQLGEWLRECPRSPGLCPQAPSHCLPGWEKRFHFVLLGGSSVLLSFGAEAAQASGRPEQLMLSGLYPERKRGRRGRL